MVGYQVLTPDDITVSSTLFDLPINKPISKQVLREQSCTTYTLTHV